MQKEEVRKQLLELILAGNLDETRILINSWAAIHSYRSAASEILDPVLEEIGQLWGGEKISLAAGYLTGKIAEETYLKILDNQEIIVKPKGCAIIGNVEDDFHSLGRRLVGIFLKNAGWNAVDLGNDVSAKTFVDSAVEHNASVIGASAMMFTTAENIIKIRNEIDERGLTSRIKLAVGGAVFKMRPELVAEVGGDGTALSALDAPALFEKLTGQTGQR
ncbi:MAG: cobalamin-dependent protein [Candidatus Riflebacteria bacterium]|nr:cobalamin-dependent protein [Candidatus Riflebacteria bacterium]